MNAEILTIGDEILIGQITNTNSVWIAQQLNFIGVKVVHMASVADDEKAIIDAFDAAQKRADFVFITGGLGPTKDDITKKTFSKYFLGYFSLQLQKCNISTYIYIINVHFYRIFVPISFAFFKPVINFIFNERATQRI